MPKSWTSSKQRCDKAKIPVQNRVYKTKPELALEMIDEDIERGVEFDWIGGDGLYGHNYQLTKGLDERGKLYVLDVHKDELLFLEEPNIFMPEKKEGRGRKPKNLKAREKQCRLDQYLISLQETDWVKVKVRKTAKGWLKLKVHVVDVWVWDGQEEQARRRILVIFEMFGTKEQYHKRLEQMKVRHKKRQKDIDRYYRYDELWE